MDVIKVVSLYYLLAFDLPPWRLSLVSNFFFYHMVEFSFLLFGSHCVFFLVSVCLFVCAGLLESARNGADGGSQARRPHRGGGGPS